MDARRPPDQFRDLAARQTRSASIISGVEVESDAELAAVRTRFEAADAATALAETGANCCYAKSDKHWVSDPQGIAWEAFHTLGAIPFFDGDEAAAPKSGSCGSPATAQNAAVSTCCAPATANACCAAADATADGSCCAPAARKASAACCS